jgi:uroporphyrinogen decarboxylase
MDHRQRVLSAVNHIEPDFVPTAIWGSTHGITDPLYFKLLKQLELGDPVPPFRRMKSHTVNYYDDRVLEALDIDVRHTDCGFADLGGPRRGGGKDCWGRAFDSFGPFERCCALRKTDIFLADLALKEDFSRLLIQKVTDVLCEGIGVYLEKAGKYLDILELPGDDYAALRPIISPRMFNHFFVPSWKRIIELVRQAAPQCKILFHSDGNMEPLLGRLIELGVDIFHCLEPLPNIDMGKIKTEYGDKLCFWGAIDIKEAMQGSKEWLRAEVKERIHLLAKGGGYVLAPANHLQPDVPVNNVLTLFRAAREYGKYPIL